MRAEPTPLTAAGHVAVLGSVNLDLVMNVERFPAPGETILAIGSSRHLGGKGANQAVAAARAGAAATLGGCIGDDAEGRHLLDLLGRERIDCTPVRRSAAALTGRAHITVDRVGANQIVVATGANADAAAFDPSGAQVLLAQLEIPVVAVTDFFGRRAAGAVTVLNAAPFRPDARTAIERADIVIVNEVELAAYAGSAEIPSTPTAVAELGATLLVGRVAAVIVTLGAAGSVTVTRDGCHIQPVAPAQAVDTTGAGDCFCGYLAAGLAGGLALAECVRIAHVAAGLAVTRPGASSAMPFRADVEAARANPPRLD